MLEAQWILSADQMAEIDRRASEQIGIDGELLMEAAGHAIWREIAALPATGGPLVCVAGPGNNGGDALVVARLAHNAGVADLAVIVFGGSDARTLARRAVIERLGITMVDWQADQAVATALLAGAATVVDGLFGNGLTRALTESARALVHAINASTATVIAIDLPSGLREATAPDDAVVQAAATAVCGYHRRAALQLAAAGPVGRLLQIDPGFPPQLVREVVQRQAMSAQLADPVADATSLPPVAAVAHKGGRGRVLVVGGSDDAPGAALLAGAGAQAQGAGYVTLATGERARQAAFVRQPGWLWHERVAAAVPDAQAVVLGPGWTDVCPQELAAFVQAAAEADVALVVDASALRCLAQLQSDWPTFARPPVLTPHPAELAALLAVGTDTVMRDSLGCVQAAAEQYRATVCLKGSLTYVASPNRGLRVYIGRCPQLAVAGSGDVLAGCIAALAARGVDPATAARTAVARHLVAGRSLAALRGWFPAEAIADEVARRYGT